MKSCQLVRYRTVSRRGNRTRRCDRVLSNCIYRGSTVMDETRHCHAPQGFHIAHWCLLAARRMAAFIALVVVVLLALDQRFDWLRHGPGGEAFNLGEQPVFMVLFAVGALIALRWKLIGGVLTTFTATGLIVFAFRQLQAFDALVVVAGFAVPAVLWLVVGLFELRDERFHRAPDEPSRPLLHRRDVLGGVVLLGATSVSGLWLSRWIFDRVYGPQHPSSVVAAVTGSPLRWIWAGAVTESSATVTARLVDNDRRGPVEFRVDTSPTLSQGTSIDVEPDEEGVLRASIDGLEPDTRYHYAFVVDGETDQARSGSFATNPSGPASFSVAFGSCSRTGSNGTVFDAIRALDPHLMVITGDLHYGDIRVEDPGRFQSVYDFQLDQPAQAAMFRQMPVAYIWDDHDWGGVDAFEGGGSAAMETYRRYVPHYPLASATSPVYQAFSVGRVRFVLTDARSGRLPNGVDGPATLLGAAQKEWLFAELLAARSSHALTIWVNPVPWISSDGGGDDWNGFAAERAEIAEFIAANDLASQLCMISGDAHMVALDDGTNSDYSRTGGAGFPVLHAAALDRPGSMKGGPYSHGAFPGGGQFGHLEVLDDGERLEAVLTGRNWRNEVLVRLDRIIATGTSG